MLASVEKLKKPSALWEENLKGLRAFIQANKDVCITPTSVAIPRVCRAEFYELLDATLKQFVLICPGFDLSGAADLSSSYQKVYHDLIKKTNLAEIKVPHSLKAFLDNPVDALAKALYPLMFDLLQEKISHQEFSQQAHKAGEASLSALSRCGYEMWLFLSVIDRLEPVRFWSVDFGADLQAIIQDMAILQPGRQHPLSERRIPDSAFETRDGVRYSLKFESAAEVGYYDVPITRRRDNTFAGNTQQVVGQRVLMMHRVPSFDDLPTIADRDTGEVVSPTLAIEVSSEQELSITAARLALGNRALSLNPSQGYVVVLPKGVQGDFWFAHDYEQVEKIPHFKFMTQSYEDRLLDSIIALLCEGEADE